MKKHRTTIIMVLFFFIGLLILLYPTISNHFNQKRQSRAITDYEKILKNYSKKDYSDILSIADTYNEELRKLDNPFITYDTLKGYSQLLNTNNDGMIGYLTIDKIKVELPIYHGTSDKVLSTAIGHLEGSSLPIGGKGTHSVLSAHRGLPSSKLFTDLDKLSLGDIFTITVLDQVLTYQVDKISIIKPNEIEDLKIDNNNDYVTLMTCTPYGINTHRLLVRGIRVSNNNLKKAYITTEAFIVNKLIVVLFLTIPIIIFLLLILLLKPSNKNIKGGNKDVKKD